MTINAIKGVSRVSTFSLILSFCALMIISAIDVVPSKQGALECIFHCVAGVFVLSLVVILICAYKCRRMRRESKLGYGNC